MALFAVYMLVDFGGAICVRLASVDSHVGQQEIPRRRMRDGVVNRGLSAFQKRTVAPVIVRIRIWERLAIHLQWVKSGP